MKLSLREMAEMSYTAGWHNPLHLAEAVATWFGESDGVTNARHTNPNGTVDRGLCAINSIHDEVSDAEADDPVFALHWSYQLFRAKNGWSPWVAFGGERYMLVFDQAKVEAVKVITRPGWPYFPGYTVLWSPEAKQLRYVKNMRDGVNDEIWAPRPDPRSGFTLWDGVRWSYVSPLNL